MKARFIFNSRVPKWFGAVGVTLYPLVFIATDIDTALRADIISHELVHVHQLEKQGWLKFHLFYFWAFLVAFVKTRSYSKAYYSITYEQEAYTLEHSELMRKEARAIVDSFKR